MINDIKTNKWLIIMVIPSILFFLVFAYLPMVGIVVAFQKFNTVKGIFGSPFVGFKNFEFFLTSPDVLRVTLNTIWLNALFILSGIALAITIAVMLSEIGGKIFKKVSQSIAILPHFMSWSIVAMLAVALFSTEEGMVNHAISMFGGKPISFYQDASVWPTLLVLLRLWQGAGFGSIVYLAAITSINQEIYEAAHIDGAGRLRCIWNITLPLLKPVAILLFIMSVGKIFHGDFGMIYAMVGGNPTLYSTTDVIDTYVYRQLTDLGDMGMSSAVGLYQSVVNFGLVLAANAIAKKVSPESAIF